jgi:hypothetical protein
MMLPDLECVRTETVVASGQPFVYPIELTSDVRESLALGPAALAPALPAAVVAAAQAGRALILLWVGHEPMPLNLDPQGRSWMFDVVQDFIRDHELPPAQVWFVVGNLWGDRLFAKWVRDRRLYEPELFRFRTSAMVPGAVQARYRANERGWDPHFDEVDDLYTFTMMPFGADQFAKRYVQPAEIAAERGSARLRPKRFLSLNRRPRLHRQLLVSYLHGRGYLEDSIVSFPVVPLELNGGCDFPMGDGPDFMRRSWQSLHSKLPLIADQLSDNREWYLVDDGWPYRDSYFNIVTETEISGDCAPFSTEKVLKPMMNFQPFILVGTADTLRYLQAMGFKGFPQLVDQVYDQLADPIARLAHLSAQIDRLAALSPAEARDRYFACLPEMAHNRAHLIDGRHELADLLADMAAQLEFDR